MFHTSCGGWLKVYIKAKIKAEILIGLHLIVLKCKYSVFIDAFVNLPTSPSKMHSMFMLLD